MKKILFLSSLFALLASACGNRQPEPETQETVNQDSVVSIPLDINVRLYGIQDSPQMMSSDLFRGLDDAL